MPTIVTSAALAARVAALGQPARPVRLGVGVAGLHVLIKPSGGASWVLRRTIGGRRLDKGLGGYPEVSLFQARQAAKGARKPSPTPALHYASYTPQEAAVHVDSDTHPPADESDTLAGHEDHHADADPPLPEPSFGLDPLSPDWDARLAEVTEALAALTERAETVRLAIGREVVRQVDAAPPRQVISVTLPVRARPSGWTVAW
jgi:hypothetical protein